MSVISTDNEITLRGNVVDIIFENDDNGYKICDVLCDDGSEITARGTLPFLFVGEFVTLTGHFENHKVYGDQFAVSGYVKEAPKNVEDIETFLSSGLIEGVGGATAKAIVKMFGADTIDVITHSPERLETVKGITHNRAVRISEAFKTYAEVSDIVVFFNKYGVKPTMAMKIYNKYGPMTIETVKRDPYLLIEEVDDIGFRVADRMALSLGFDIRAGSRVCAGIIYMLKQALGNGGHVYLPRETLVRETARMLGTDEETTERCLESLIASQRVMNADDRIFIDYMYRAEEYVASRLVNIAKGTRAIDDRDFDDCIKQFADNAGFMPDSVQCDAVRQSASSGFSIITGGPGTGKTTIIRALVHLFSIRKCKCELAAPTGRAAKRMAEACGAQAKTIHRLLELNMLSDDDNMDSHEDIRLSFKRNESNPLEADVFIIDEASMLDILLLYHLLKAVPDNAQLILVGDKDQLPSVGAGNVLKDLIRSEHFTTLVLHDIYRQETQSMIAVNAHHINCGEMPELNLPERDFFMLHRRTPEETMATMVDVVCRRLPATYGIDPMRDIQVLIPNKKGVCGVANANALLQAELNPVGARSVEYDIGSSVFREGDRVMQVRNNYEMEWRRRDKLGAEGKGIFNGEMGVIERINSKAREVAILFDDDRLALYDYPSMSNIELCYAVTVHKSQGSEFDYCVIPLMQAPPMLMTRNILYTAITRARKMVVLIGDVQCVQHMIANNSEQKRYTYLMERINIAAERDV